MAAMDQCSRSAGSGRVDLHGHGFGFGEELAAEVPTLTPDARSTGAAEGRVQVPDEEVLHPRRTDVESGRHTMCTVEVVGEQLSVQAVRSAVGELNYLVLGVEGVNHDHRTEDFLEDLLGVQGHVDQDRGLDHPALTGATG